MNLIEKALSQFGTREIEGTNDNPEILKYFHAIGFDGTKLKEETAWCSAFVNWVAKESGYGYSEKLNARSWLSIGKETQNPELGDVAVLWRQDKNCWKGHVGFYIKETRNHVYLLGGNQNNKVCIKPYSKNRILNYRKLEKNG